MSAAPSSPPPTSAAVLEFICLFTHDLKQKKKRWQDGRLKHHTFNNRVMVYDDRGNFVGDMHWRHDWDLAEGEELQLQRGGVIVQVQELSSRCEQDLSELLDKRAKEKEKRQIQAVARAPASNALPRTAVRPVVTRPMQANHLQQHRPLHQLIGTPKAHHGRALVPKESPFEQRQQAAESPDDRAAKRRKYNEPAPSKSGYASALFGQALTLSATPMSSLPAVSRRAVLEQDPTPEKEDTIMQAAREEPHQPFKEQPKSSRHFNPSTERPRSFEKAKSAMPDRGEVEDDDQLPTRQKKDRTLPKKQPVHRRRQPSLVDDINDDEVIEIDDPDTNMMDEANRSDRAERETSKPPKARKKTVAKSKVTVTKRSSRESTARPEPTEDPPDEEPDQLPHVSRKQERLAELKTSTPKALVKNTTVKTSASKSVQEPPLEAFTRNPSIPVTELRLKSRKKRGLMMISDLPKEPRVQREGSNEAMAAIGRDRAHEVEEINYSVRSPSPQPLEEIGTMHASHGHKTLDPLMNPTAVDEDDEGLWFPSSELHEIRDKPTSPKGEALGCHNLLLEFGADDAPVELPMPQLRSEQPRLGSVDETVSERRASDEIGEVTRPRVVKEVVEKSVQFEAPSPSLLSPGEDIGAPDEAIEEQVQKADHLKSIPDDGFGTTTKINTEAIATKPVEGLVLNAIGRPPPQGLVYDPYRMPPSSPEEFFKSPPRLAVSPGTRNSPLERHVKFKVTAPNGDFDERKSTDNSRNLTKSTRLRAGRRNLILDDDDEPDDSSESPEPTEVGVLDAMELESDSDLPVRKQQVQRKNAVKRKSAMQEDLGEDEDGFDLGDLPGKKQAKPKKPTKTAKRKSKAEEEKPELETEEPVKRRRPTRKTRGRAAGPEEDLVRNEQENSEEDSRFKKTYKKKAPKASATRPRLEKLKRSVKSRELIGFNLSALNLPLGVRGIGVPFSILSPPANESIQRRLEDHAAMQPSSDPVLEDLNERMQVATSDVLETIDDADEGAPARLSSPAVQRRQRPEPLAPLSELPISTEDHGKLQAQVPKAMLSLVLSGGASLKTSSVEQEGKSWQQALEALRLGQTLASKTAPSKKTLISPMPARQGPGDEVQATETPAEPATVELPPPSEKQEPPPTGASAAIATAEKTETITTIVQRTKSRLSMSTGLFSGRAVDVPGSAVTATSTSRNKRPVPKPFVPPSKTFNATIQHQEMTTGATIHEDSVPDETDAEVLDAIGAKMATILPAFKRPEPKATPVLAQQPSITAVDRIPADMELEIVVEVNAPAVPAVPGLPPFKRPEQIPVVQREPPAVGKADLEVALGDQTKLEDASETASMALSALPAFRRPAKLPVLQRKSSHDARTGAAVEAEELESSMSSEAIAIAASNLPAFKRPEQRTAPSLLRESSITADSSEEGGSKDDRNIADTVNMLVAVDPQQDVHENAQNPVRALRRQPPGFKPPVKAKTSKIQIDTGKSKSIAVENGSAHVEPFAATCVSSRQAVKNMDGDTTEAEPRERDFGAADNSIPDAVPAAPVHIAKPRVLQRTASANRRINNITAEPTESLEPAESSSKAAINARITNPASRGRKAATKSDAKGPVPQRMLPPTQPFVMGPISTADFAMTPLEEPEPPKAPGRQKKKMTFPGFQSARDEGPWSREAYDLLETGRPGK